MTDFPALLRKEADAIERGQFAHPGNIRAAADVLQDLLTRNDMSLNTIKELRDEIRAMQAWEEADVKGATWEAMLALVGALEAQAKAHGSPRFLSIRSSLALSHARAVLNKMEEADD